MSEQQTKIFFIGPQGTGKTNLVYRITGREYDPNIKSTIGFGLSTSTLTFENESMDIEIWDLADNERFMIMSSYFIQDVQMVVAVFDSNNYESFVKMQRILNGKFYFT